MDDREILAYVELRVRVLKRKEEDLWDGQGNMPGYISHLEGRIHELRQLARVLRAKTMLKHNSRMKRFEEMLRSERESYFAKLRAKRGR